MLFDQIVAEASILRENFSKDPALTNDSYHGHFCTLKACDSISNDETKLQLHYFDETDLVKLPLFVFSTSVTTHWSNVARVNMVESFDSIYFGPEEKSTAGKTINFLRHYNSSTGEYDYYMMPHNLDDVVINGVYVDRYRIAGPLPDFAVLELEQCSYFWWRTADALEYVPVGGSMVSPALR